LFFQRWVEPEAQVCWHYRTKAFQMVFSVRKKIVWDAKNAAGVLIGEGCF
jgi:hypothetical protein